MRILKNIIIAVMTISVLSQASVCGGTPSGWLLVNTLMLIAGIIIL